MTVKTGTVVLVINKNNGISEATEKLIEKLQQMGRDVVIIKVDKTAFPNLFSGETAKDFLASIMENIKVLN
jgi:fructoselysine-6-P-deglycase FrlB-like protein